MAARLNMNEIPYFSWKGKTLQQITSVLRQNKNDQPNLSVRQISKAMPLKLYRKEIANAIVSGNRTSCSRASVKIANFEQPGQTIVSSKSGNTATIQGITNTLDITPTTIQGEHPGKCSSTCNNNVPIFSPETNAKRRVRSAGMIPKKFNVNKNNDQYYTSTNQYLVARNKTIQQNGYVFLRQGSSGVQPGTAISKSNIYSPQGLSHCNHPAITAANGNNTFTYTWINQIEYPVTIPDGQYDVEGLRNAFYQSMVANGHYFILLTSRAKVFPISFDYNTYTQTIIIEANPVVKDSVGSLSSFPTTTYTTPTGTTWYSGLVDGSYNTAVNLTNAAFAALIGFVPGSITAGSRTSTSKPQISPNYVTLYYKPSNQTFGQQGSVDGSTYTQRQKLNAVTKGGYLTKSAYGSAVADALAYGVSEQAFTQKQVIGYTNTPTPVINKNGQVCCVENYIYRRG
jgi:hypothetical protein